MGLAALAACAAWLALAMRYHAAQILRSWSSMTCTCPPAWMADVDLWCMHAWRTVSVQRACLETYLEALRACCHIL